MMPMSHLNPRFWFIRRDFTHVMNFGRFISTAEIVYYFCRYMHAYIICMHVSESRLTPEIIRPGLGIRRTSYYLFACLIISVSFIFIHFIYCGGFSFLFLLLFK